MSSKKMRQINSQATGEQLPAEPKPQAEVPVEETFQHQQEVLSEDKPKWKIELADGNFIELPNELTVGDILKRRIFQAITSTVTLVHMWANKFAGKNEPMPDIRAIINALTNPIVQEEIESLVVRVTGVSLSSIEANISVNGAIEIYKWMIAQFEQNAVSQKAKK